MVNAIGRGPRHSVQRRGFRAPGGASMNYARTAILLAGLTGLFMAVGYLIGGSGALIALIIAAATNLFS